ncbi:MAG: ImmA/IrrE family metallo-endopeptidase [Alphaproteobacteria bacterium]
MKVNYVHPRTIKTYADTLRTEYQDGLVTDVIGIATQKLGLRINFFELEKLYGKGTLGMILPDEKLILCEKFQEPKGKNKENLERILRFTVAHEIGHYVMHREYMVNCESPLFHQKLPAKERQNLEIQANGLAAELLMPEELFSEEYYNFTIRLRNDDQAELKRHLASLFCVSEKATSNRIKGLKL